MRNYRQVVEFANFICHFDDKVLLDYLEEIVLPAFLGDKASRQYGGSRYMLLDVKLMDLASTTDRNPVPALAGKFVLDTQLRRDQVLENGRLVPSAQAMPSAPSSQFVLLLESHKLIFAKQVAGAPGLASFRTTVELLLRWQRDAYIRTIYEKAKAARKEDPSKPAVTKKLLQESIPRPELELVPLTGKKGLTDLVNQFKKLNEIRIKVVRPNAEINNRGIFAPIEAARAQVDADATTLVHRNPAGLNKEQSINQIAPVMNGNVVVKLTGVGENNEKLVGTNDEMSFREVIALPRGFKRGAELMYHSFKRLVASGILNVGKVINSDENKSKLEGLKLGK